MIKKIWRYTHLIVACIIFIYLIIASVTGAILGVHQAMQPTHTDANISIADAVKKAKNSYEEIISIKKKDEQYLEIHAYDEEYNEIKSIWNPQTGKISEKKKEKNTFIDWNTSLHRSLFLEKNGRFIVGILTILFLIELITGVLYMIRIVPQKKQLITKWKYANFPLTYHHSVSRLVFIPLLILTITGIVLFSFRFNILQEKTQPEQTFTAKSNPTSIENFNFLKINTLEKLVAIDFPFDDSENVKIETTDGKYELDYNTGDIVWQQKNANSTKWKNLSFNLHTGKFGTIWAWIITLSVLTIPGFIITGFMLFARKKQPKSKDFSSPQEAETIILYGSENGSTRQQAFMYAKQISQIGNKVFFGTLNQISHFPKAEKMIILTSTYGDGDAPSNALDFIKKLPKVEINTSIKIGIIGFGSKDYPRFNEFAECIHTAIQNEKWGKNILFFEKINDRNTQEIDAAEKQIANKLNINISSKYINNKEKGKEIKYQTVKINKKSNISEENKYCSIELSPTEKNFQSGDLLRIQIPNFEEFRHYSISKNQQNIALFTKYIENGKCSEYLKSLSEGDELSVAIEENTNFHFENKPTILICNGTGIAPFIGMIENNSLKTPIKLYAGFRHREKATELLKEKLSQYKNEKLLEDLQWTYSRGENSSRITNLLKRDISEIVKHLMKGNIVMICGALELKKEVETLIAAELKNQNHSLSVDDFYIKNILKSDCY